MRRGGEKESNFLGIALNNRDEWINGFVTLMMMSGGMQCTSNSYNLPRTSSNLPREVERFHKDTVCETAS